MSCPALKDDIRRLWAESAIGGRVLFDHPLAGYTSLGVGGPAQVLLFPQSINDLAMTNEFAQQHNLPIMLLGGGCNLVIRDGGIGGLVVCLKEGFNSLARKGDCLVVQAGTRLPTVISFAIDEALGGLESLAGIPGTLGGAVFMNAGTAQGSIAQVLEELKLLTTDSQLKILGKDRLEFGYRQSYLPQGSIILEAKLKLTPQPRKEIENRLKKTLSQRAGNQPIGEMSAGCIFKNPPGGYAGKLIEAVGLKGHRLGDAEVSTKHANFIINKGQASAKDVLGLIKLIKQRVWEKNKISLEEEVVIVGQE